MILTDSDTRHDMSFGTTVVVNEAGGGTLSGWGPWHLSSSCDISLDKLPEVLIYYIKTDI
jgi:hypothetical protein